MQAHHLHGFAVFMAVSGPSLWPQHAVHHNDSVFVKSPFSSVFLFCLCTGETSDILAPSRASYCKFRGPFHDVISSLMILYKRLHSSS